MSAIFFQKVRLFNGYLASLLFVGSMLSVPACANSSDDYSAHWIIESDKPLKTRMKNTVWLAVVSDEAIAARIAIEPIKVKNLFIEKANSGAIYTKRKINGKHQHVAQIKYDIYPAKSAEFTLPAAKVTIGRGAKASEIVANAKLVEVAAQPSKAAGLVITSSLSLSQTLSAVEIIAGGAVSREISIDVVDLPGYLIAELPLSTLTGTGETDVRIASSSTKNQSFRGTVTGKRATELQYQFSQAGQYTLPAITLKWWHPSKLRVEQSHLPAVKVNVLPPPPLPFKQQVALWQANVNAVLLAYWPMMTLVMLTLLLTLWQKQRLFRVVGSTRLTLVQFAQRPTILVCLLLVKVALSPAGKLPPLLKKWQTMLPVKLQPQAKILDEMLHYKASGELSVKRGQLLKQMVCMSWRYYYQRFGLQPLNP